MSRRQRKWGISPGLILAVWLSRRPETGAPAGAEKKLSPANPTGIFPGVYSVTRLAPGGPVSGTGRWLSWRPAGTRLRMGHGSGTPGTRTTPLTTPSSPDIQGHRPVRRTPKPGRNRTGLPDPALSAARQAAHPQVVINLCNSSLTARKSSGHPLDSGEFLGDRFVKPTTTDRETTRNRSGGPAHRPRTKPGQGQRRESGCRERSGGDDGKKNRRWPL
jgi:hypothetical protein